MDGLPLALFVPKGRIRRLDPLLWALIPLSYLVLAFVYSGLGGRFPGETAVPYPFMDVEVHGVGGVALWILVLAVALTAVGFGYSALDRWLGRRGADRGATVPARHAAPADGVDGGR